MEREGLGRVDRRANFDDEGWLVGVDDDGSRRRGHKNNLTFPTHINPSSHLP